MGQDNSILEPLEMFNKQLKGQNSENAAKYFDEFAKKAGIDPKANAQAVNDYNQKCLARDLAKKEARKIHAKKVLLILLGSFVIAAGVVFIILAVAAQLFMPLYIYILLAIFLIGGGIGIIILTNKMLNGKIKDKDQALAAREAEAQAALQLCWAMMNPLNSLYDWNMQADVIKMTTPLLELDKNFDIKKYAYLEEKYGLSQLDDSFRSVNFVQSGAVQGNPFFIRKDLIQTTFMKRYTGSIVISWTTTSKDSDGNTQIVNHTQTLTAYVDKPAPAYHYETYLIYANDAAPDLSFSRIPQVSINASDRDLKHQVEKEEKKIHKASERAVDDAGHQFTELWNPEFESLFHALDRDQEVQFRLLFTPLAQKNELNLIKSKAPYGDDFNFTKVKCLNIIYSRHSQALDYSGNPGYFIDYDLNNAKKKFVSYCDNYFQGLFFDMAPLLSIPLYQQNKPQEYLYKQEYEMNISPYEDMVLANSFDRNLLKPLNAVTESILRTSFEGKEGDSDKIRITAHAYSGTQMVDYISVLGGDERIHQVPVYWVKYDPVSKDTFMVIKKYPTTRYSYNHQGLADLLSAFQTKTFGASGLHYERCLLAMLLANSDLSPEEGKKLEELTKEGK
ncbi:MAG: hypothetical protein LKJ88_04335 [Bacilli bacterium]|jgi:hypothetical protein|nr:hypothetical protein [Bacilli bacterium]